LRLAFVADVHVSDTFDEETGEEWLDQWFALLAEDNDVDHLAICGDLIGTYESPSDSEDFATLRAILRRHGWYSAKRTSLVPGNHDVRVWGNVEDDYARGVHMRFPTLFKKHVRPSPYHFPSVKRFGGVTLIGLDSASGMGNISLHSGMLGEEQIEELARVLALPSVAKSHVILMLHHPPFEGFASTTIEGELHDAEDFWEVVNSTNVDLIVCGHEHESREIEHDESVPVVCVGGFLKDDTDALIVDAGEGKLRHFWWDAWK
jgi:3',5'-cyclic AMP phosphodiesterase CpdA